jgi:hypothetical protein
MLPVNSIRLSRATLRPSQWDAVMAVLAAAHLAVLMSMPKAPVIALGLWWNANTISHNFIHRPFFRHRSANRLFTIYLTALVGIPQSLWRDRHLAHHAGAQHRVRFSSELVIEVALLLALWTAVAALAPGFLLHVYAPGYAAGLVLCSLHGHYEHARGGTSYYGKLYNALFFNDGYHTEHHAHPDVHWTRLPAFHESTVVSAWPAPVRWVEAFSLAGLERAAVKSHILQRFVLRTHGRALRGLLKGHAKVGRVAIVGGGLFPRTALILRDLLPGAHLTIIDANGANLDQARDLISGTNVEFVHARYVTADTCTDDLLVIPLSFDGDRRAIYAHPPAPVVIVHDWIWRKRGISRVVSIGLLKRINLIRR